MPRSLVYSRPRSSPEETLLDFLVKKFTYLTRDQWTNHLASGHVSVNDAVVTDGDVVLQQRDVVQFSPPRSLEPPVDEEHLRIRYEDADVLVCAKNGNLPVCEGGRYCLNTLVGVLSRRQAPPAETVDVSAATCSSGKPARELRKRGREEGHRTPDSGPDGAPNPCYFPVHRLDKETSGLVVLAKAPNVANTLREQFAAQSDALVREIEDGGLLSHERVAELLETKTGVRKRYVALLAGAAPVNSVFLVQNRIGSVAEHPLLKDLPEHQKLKKLKVVGEPQDAAVVAGSTFGKVALSRISIMSSSATLKLSVAQVDILTGRTHQIRLHCAEVGYPVLGDKLYSTRAPATRGHSYAVDDALYLERVRAVDPVTGHTAFSPDALQPQWQCRRHCLHAAELSFTHPSDGAGTWLRFHEPPAEWFLRDIRLSAKEEGPSQESDAALMKELGELLHGQDA